MLKKLWCRDMSSIILISPFRGLTVVFLGGDCQLLLKMQKMCAEKLEEEDKNRTTNMFFRRKDVLTEISPYIDAKKATFSSFLLSRSQPRKERRPWTKLKTAKETFSVDASSNLTQRDVT